MEEPGRPTVLVVEDDPAVRELFGEALGPAGYGVEASATLPEALAILGRGGIAVILTDALGADRTGPDLAFFGSLRAVAPGVPIILCTARPWARDVDAGRHRLVAVLPKPFELDGLLGAIARAVRPDDVAAPRPSP